MLRSDDDDGIDTFIVQKPAEVLVGFDPRNDGLHLLEMTSVHIGHGHRFDVGTLDGLLEIILAPRARPDQPNSNSIIRAEDAA